MNGHECVAFCEIDKYARQSYKAIYDTKGEVEWHDITQVSNDDFRSFRGRADVITGGFPCQAFSIAGKRRGFADTRGTLFFEIARAIKEIQPSYALLENVKGLFSHDKGRTFGTIIQALDELGYVVEWGLFNSKYWGVPQNRERVFILATRKDIFRQPKLIELLNEQTEVNTKLIDVLEHDVDEKYFLSEEKTSKLILNNDLSSTLHHFGQPKIRVLGNTSGTGYAAENVHDTNGVSPTIQARDYKGPKQIAIPGNTVKKVYSLEDLEERFMNESDLLKQGEIKQIIFDEFGVDRKCNRCTNQVLISDIKGYPYLCFECDENLFEFETYKDIEMVIGSTQKNAATTDGTLSPTLTSAMGQGGGHVPMAVYKDPEKFAKPKEEQAVVLGVGHHPLSKKREFNGYGDLSPTLIATDYKAPKTALMSDFRIRKLTPLECFRLQGFTDEQFYKAKNDGVSNSQLYKQAGNSVTVNVIDAIARRLT